MKEPMIYIGKEKMPLSEAIKKGIVKSEKKKPVKDEPKIDTKD